MNQDKSFCSNKNCKYKKCDRHCSKIDWTIAPPWRSFVMFEGTKYCPLKKGGAG